MQLTRILRHSKKLPLFMLCIGMLWACDNRPDTAQCNAYYRRMLELSSTQPPAFRIALQNSSARSAVMDYCMNMDRYRVQCSARAGTGAEVTACETGPDSTFMQRVEMEWDTISDEFDDGVTE